MNTEVLGARVSDSTSPWHWYRCDGNCAIPRRSSSLIKAEAAKLQRSGKERADVVPANTSPLPVLGDSFFPRRPTTIMVSVLFLDCSMLCICRACGYLIPKVGFTLRWFVRDSPPCRVHDTLVVL